jgi:hypothetical protein
MRRNAIIAAALAVALTSPALAYAQSDAASTYSGHSHHPMRSAHATHRHYADQRRYAEHRQAYRASPPPASGGSAGVPGSGGCDPAASSASASAPVGQAAPGCK